MVGLGSWDRSFHPQFLGFSSFPHGKAAAAKAIPSFGRNLVRTQQPKFWLKVSRA